MTPERQKLAARVVKLLALAAGTTFAAEADSARAMAEALIAKHNIELPSNKDRSAIDSICYRPHFAGAKWEYILADAVAALCGCDVFFNGDKLSVFAIVGTVADLEACQYLLAILHQRRMRDWVRAKANGTPDSFYSFCFSFARGVEENIKAQITALKSERTKQAWIWWDKKIGGIEKVDLNTRGQGRSEAGRNAGAAASLHRGEVGGQAAPKLLPKS